MNNEVNLILTKLKIVSEEKENGMYLCNKKHSKALLNYITNLQEENERLTAESTQWEERTYCWQDRAEDLEIIIDKAIEVIDLIKPELWNISNKMTYRLIDVKNILNGGDDNE